MCSRVISFKTETPAQPSPKDQIFTVELPCAFYPCLMTAGSFLTASCSPTPLPVVSTGPSLFPVAQEIPTCRSLHALHRELPEASHFPSGGRHLSYLLNFYQLEDHGEFYFCLSFQTVHILGLRDFIFQSHFLRQPHFPASVPQPGTQQGSKNVYQIKERMQDCSSDPVTFP